MQKDNRSYFEGQLGKPRSTQYHPNSRNWKYKIMVKNILQNVYLITDIKDQLKAINDFKINGKPVGCAKIILYHLNQFIAFMDAGFIKK